jgi:hypothetical protein
MELLGPRLSWLADPDLIPSHAVDAAVASNDFRHAAFSLAAWMLIELVEAADQLYQKLDWEQTITRFRVPPRLQASVLRAVLCPASRYAPGLFAIAEIISVIPVVASRSGLSRDCWHKIARRSEAFGAMLSRDGTVVQVLVRKYLSRSDSGADGRSVRFLNPALLRLDAGCGVTTVTPLGDLLTAAREAAARHKAWSRANCLALHVLAPQANDGRAASTMFGAIWSSFADAANRLVFPRFDNCRELVPPETVPDLGFAETFKRLAAERGEELAQAASQPYPPTVERILGNLLAARRSRAAVC